METIPVPAPERGVQHRWTPGIAAEGFTPMATLFLENYAQLGITSIEAMLITHLMSFKWDAKEPYPSFATLAKLMGITPTAVRNHARKLEKKGFLRRQRRFSQSNKFDLLPLFRALESFKKARGPRSPRREKVAAQ